MIRISVIGAALLVELLVSVLQGLHPTWLISGMGMTSHFLYNTLDSIRIQVEIYGDKKVANLLMRLSEFYRLSVKEEASMVTLDDELEMLEAYMELMCYRYPNLKCEYDIDPDLGDVLVPNFILQPLVENSLQHGLKNKSYQGSIAICVNQGKNGLEIAIKDTGSGFAEG